MVEKKNKMSSDKVRALERHLWQNLGAYQGKAALKFGEGLACINRIVHSKAGLNYRRRKRVLAVTGERRSMLSKIMLKSLTDMKNPVRGKD